MVASVREVMHGNPVCVPVTTPIREAARMMRDQNIGDVLVVDGDRLRGIVTDRDIVVRGIAEGNDVERTPVQDVCSPQLVVVTPDDALDRAVQLMREHAVRRLPVAEGDRPVGIVSIGDLALEKDPDSALADISGSPPNR